MDGYRRPPLDTAEFRDAAGTPIPYGQRYWTVDVEPPENAYGRCAHPERFEPVVQIGHALIDHLTATYDVRREDERAGGRPVVVLAPAAGGGATLRITLPLPSLPGVEVRAGWRFRGLWPDCGCDACDDSVPDLLDDLEASVLTIVEGGMSEWRSGPDPASPLITDDAGNPIGDSHVPWRVHARLDGRLRTETGGWSDGEPDPVELPDEPFHWPAWPLRTA